ncbi:hypothetical protein [Vibrio cholerae]|uniref:hypothetical protein n=1 Tax=Vibrio cholerae TaxID=666 RepID=UPI00084AD438|nr:hypothetical protein [Vibrio cholerae]OEC22190.1 hypothetical protein BFX10_10695 [Vibrio cholerae]
MQSTNQTISKIQYMDILEQQRAYLEKKADNAKMDLFTLESAIEELEQRDFSEVEVIQEGETFTFKIKDSSND